VLYFWAVFERSVQVAEISGHIVMSEVQFGGASVADVMHTDPPLIVVNDKLCKVARILRRISHVWVVAEAGSRVVVGVITEREFLDLLSPMPEREYATGVIRPKSLYHAEKSTAEEFMSRPVIGCKPSTSIEKALEILREKHIRHLAVIEDGELVGELSLKGIIAAYYIDSCSMFDC